MKKAGCRRPFPKHFPPTKWIWVWRRDNRDAALNIWLQSRHSGSKQTGRTKRMFKGSVRHALGQGDWEHIQGLMSAPLPSLAAHCDGAVERASLTRLPPHHGSMVRALTAIALETWCWDPRPRESWHGDSAVQRERPGIGAQAAQIQFQLCDLRWARTISWKGNEDKWHLIIFKQWGKISVFLSTVNRICTHYSASRCQWTQVIYYISCHHDAAQVMCWPSVYPHLKIYTHIKEPAINTSMHHLTHLSSITLMNR